MPSIYALDFDGSNDYLNYNETYKPTNFSLEAWIKPTNFSAQRYIYSGFASDIQWAIDTSGYQVFSVWNGAGYTDITDTTLLTAGVWQHVAITYDGVTIKLYINGSPTNSGAATLVWEGAGSNHLQWGARATASKFLGKMTDMRFWDDERSAGEIAANYLSELVGNETNLQICLKLTEGSGLTAYDETANNRDFTLIGTPDWVTDVPDHLKDLSAMFMFF